MELAKDLDVLCSATVQQLRRLVGVMAQCVPYPGGDDDAGDCGDDGDNG